MKPQIALIISVILLGVAAFCVFGFLATFEPSNIPGLNFAFRVGYVVLGIACVSTAIAFVVKTLRG
jgi:hypothetical protein